MILYDAGFMVGAINEDDQYHAHCIAALRSVSPRFVTTWPCITEAMYLLRTQSAQEKLRRQIERRMITVHAATQEDAERACALMRKYVDTPMDFADASLVVAAEVLGITRILTLDRHFYAYRVHDSHPFDLVVGTPRN